MSMIFNLEAIVSPEGHTWLPQAHTIQNAVLYLENGKTSIAVRLQTSNRDKPYSLPNLVCMDLSRIPTDSGEHKWAIGISQRKADVL